MNEKYRLISATMCRHEPNEKDMLLPPYNVDGIFNFIPNIYDSTEPMNYKMHFRDGRPNNIISCCVGIMKAIGRVRIILEQQKKGNKMEGFGGWAKLKSGGVVAEYWANKDKRFKGVAVDHLDDPRVIIRIAEDGQLSAVCVDGRKTTPYNINTRDFATDSEFIGGSAMVYALMANAFEYSGSDSKCAELCALLKAEAEKIADNPTDIKQAIVLYNNIYAMIAYSDEVKKAFALTDNPLDECNIPITGNIALLDLQGLGDDIDPSTINGSLSFTDAKPVKVKKSTSIMDYAGVFNPDPTRTLSDEEKAMIPVIDPKWMIPDKVLDIAEMIQKSGSLKTPIRNFMLSGPAGTGKSEWCKILAMMLGRPYVSFVCAPDTEKMDLTLSIIPNAESEDDDEPISLESFGSPEDWSFDPVGSFGMITGIKKDDATPLDCLMAVLNKASNKDKGFKYVYSSIVQAVSHGYVCAIEEPSIIAKPGVLPALNSLFDRSQSITLMNGETIQRHPDCVICFTTNVDYEGCNPMNQSIKSRCVSVNLEEPSSKELEKRVIAATGYSNKDVVRRMVEVFKACQKKAEEQCISDGAIDFRALEQWATANMINGQLYKNGKMCLIDKTTGMADVIPEFLHCLEAHFKKEE